MDYNNFSFCPPYGDPTNFDPQMAENPIFNTMMQYEQGYMYYRYLTMQLEYKIKCKEYEKICGTKVRSNE